jgi:hypothetical protein
MDIDFEDSSGELERHLKEKNEKKLKKTTEGLSSLVPINSYDEDDEETPIRNSIEDFFPTTKGKFKKNENLRHAGQQVQYTPKVLEEYVRCSEDIIYFAEKYFYIINIDEGKQSITLRDYQKKMIKAFVGDDEDPRKNCIVLSSRQIGKCVYDSVVKLRNKTTGEIVYTKLEDFYHSLKNKHI